MTDEFYWRIMVRRSCLELPMTIFVLIATSGLVQTPASAPADPPVTLDALMDAIFHDELAKMRVILDKAPRLASQPSRGDDFVPMRVYEETPLHMAAGHPAAAELLVERGANVNAKDRNGL